MPLAKVQSRGQITLPSKVRKKIGCKPGDTVVIEPVGPGEARLRVLPHLTVAELVERYPITEPIDWQHAHEEWEEIAAREFMENMQRNVDENTGS